MAAAAKPAAAHPHPGIAAMTPVNPSPAPAAPPCHAGAPPAAPAAAPPVKMPLTPLKMLVESGVRKCFDSAPTSCDPIALSAPSAPPCSGKRRCENGGNVVGRDRGGHRVEERGGGRTRRRERLRHAARTDQAGRDLRKARHAECRERGNHPRRQDVRVLVGFGPEVLIRRPLGVRHQDRVFLF